MKNSYLNKIKVSYDENKKSDLFIYILIGFGIFSLILAAILMFVLYLVFKS